MGYSRYIGRVGAVAIALGIGAALGATPWLASAEPSTSGSSMHSASTAPSSDSSSTGAATSRTGAVSGKSDSAPSTASGSTQKSTESPIGQVRSKSASDTSSASSQPATRSAERGVAVSTGGADTSSPTGSSRSAGAAATTAASGSKPDSTDATAPAQPTTAPATSGTTAAKTTRSAAVANTHASRTTAPASGVDATRVVAAAVQMPTAPLVSAAATTPVPTAATMDIAPDVKVSRLPAAATTTTALTDPPETVVEIVSSVVDAVLSPFASGTAPGEPAQTPALWTLAAFARREIDQAFSNPQPTISPMAGSTSNGLVVDTPTLSGQSMDPALTGEAPPLADASIVTPLAQPNATAAPATFTGAPSFVSQVFTGFFRVLRAVGDALGVDLTIPLTQSISSDSPPWLTTLGLNVQRSEFEGMPVWTLQPANPSGKYVVAVHGGAFVVQPNIWNWFNYAAMARDAGATVIVPIYPLEPQGTAATVVPAMADLISAQIDPHGAENVSVYGDSAGGNIALAAVQELVRRGDPVPSHMVLISPALDLTLSNPAIQFVDDPLFSGMVPTLRNYGQLWAGDLDLTDPLVSPLYGSLAGLPPTAIYAGNLEILAPDVLVLQDKALATPGADFTFILRKGELHDWAVLTILPETVAVLPDIYHQLGIGSVASPTLSGQSMDPALTGEAPPLADASIVTSFAQLDATAAPATFTGQPSIVSQVFTGFYRVLGAVGDFLGVDLVTPLGHLLSSDSPPWFTTLGLNVQRSEFEGMPVWTLQSPGSTSEKNVVAIPGSAFILPPTIFHWFNYAAMASNTGATVIVPIYPLVPQGGTAGTVVPAMADLISSQIDQHGAENVSVYGDSLGGAILLAAVQELVRRGDPVPSHMVLNSPALDATLSNPAIQFVDDPVLSPLLPTLHKNAQLWAGDLDLTDPLVSPLFGSLAGLPPTAVYYGNLDILAPDGLVLQDNALATPGADFTFILRKGEIHIWALNTILPETIAVLPDIYHQLGIGSDASPTLSGQSMDVSDAVRSPQLREARS